MYIDAIKPVTSPTTPPPRAISRDLRLTFSPISCFTTLRTVLSDFEASPAGISMISTGKAVSLKFSFTASPYNGLTSESVMITHRSA